MLQPLRRQNPLEGHLARDTLICTFRYFFDIFLWFFVPPVISAFKGAIFVFLAFEYSSQIQGERLLPPTSLNLNLA